MSDSDDDYMSDKLLAGCTSTDVRPGLLFNRTQKRTHEMYKEKLTEKAKKPKTYHDQEKEAREKGLSTAISSDNIGFKLLQKMGFKEGNSLGSTESGIKEPINVALKEGTSGVGREKHLDDIAKKKLELQKQSRQIQEEEYIAARQLKTTKSLLKSDFFKSQRVCEELDERESIKKPLWPFFWSKQASKSSEDSSDESESDDTEDIITEENLRQILDYLREKHLYCLYCGIKCTDEEDLRGSCPGPYREDHTEDLS
ncbi:hypothetical protein Trydic_g21993 [Trypoxylus dichotomus]